MHDLVDAARGDTSRLGDLSLGEPQLDGFTDEEIPTLCEVFALDVYAADVVSQLSKRGQRILAGHLDLSMFLASFVAMTTLVLAERRHSK